MNPLFKALNGANGAVNPQTMNSAPAPMNGGMGGIFGRMQQLAGMFQNPQTMVQRVFPDAPAEAANDPNQLLQWMQQTGKVNTQMIQMAKQMMGGR